MRFQFSVGKKKGDSTGLKKEYLKSEELKVVSRRNKFYKGGREKCRFP